MLKVHTYEASGSLQMSQSFFLPVLVIRKSKVNGWEYGWRTNFTGFQLQFIGFSQGTWQEQDPCLVQRSVCQLTKFTRNSIFASFLTELHAAWNILTLCCASSNQIFLSVFCFYFGIVWWMLTLLVVKEINLRKTLTIEIWWGSHPLRLVIFHGVQGLNLGKEGECTKVSSPFIMPYSKTLPVWENRIGF